MDTKELKQRAEKLPAGEPRSLFLGIAESLETLGQASTQTASLRQELDALKSAPDHGAGLCGEEGCQPCQDARVSVAHQTQEEIVSLFEAAAERYGLEGELAVLAEAVKHHRAGDEKWSPRQAVIEVGA